MKNMLHIKYILDQYGHLTIYYIYSDVLPDCLQKRLLTTLKHSMPIGFGYLTVDTCLLPLWQMSSRLRLKWQHSYPNNPRSGRRLLKVKALEAKKNLVSENLDYVAVVASHVLRQLIVSFKMFRYVLIFNLAIIALCRCDDAPDFYTFTVQDVDGEEVSLEKYRGTVRKYYFTAERRT